MFNNKTNDDNKSKNLNKVYNSPKYKENELKIKCIKKALIEHAYVPEELINSLIDSVEQNIILELNNK